MNKDEVFETIFNTLDYYFENMNLHDKTYLVTEIVDSLEENGMNFEEEKNLCIK